MGKNFQGNDTKFFGPRSLVSSIVSSGVKKLLGYLEEVTGESFVKEFIDSVSILYKNRNTFLDALHFHKELHKAEFSNWFLVTSSDQHKIDEAIELKNEADQFIHEDYLLVIDRCLTADFHTWLPKNEAAQQLKNSLLKREQSLKEFPSKNFKNIIEFQEVLEPSPQNHVTILAKEFSHY